MKMPEEKSYNNRYDTSLMENSKVVKEQGIEAFLGCKKKGTYVPDVGASFLFMMQSAVNVSMCLMRKAGLVI